MTNAMNLIAAALAAPKTHTVVTTYTDGRTKRFDTRSEATAEGHAVGERRKIGKNLIDRDTGKIVRVAKVEIARINQ